MSYILDALRRADAERQRGAVPGLHDQPALMGPAVAQRTPRSVPLGWVLGAVVLLALALAVGWWQADQGRLQHPGKRDPAQAIAGAASAVVDTAPVAPAPATPTPLAGVAPAPAPLPAPPPTAPPTPPPTALTSAGTTTVTVTVNGSAATAPTRVAVVAEAPASAAPSTPAKPAQAARLTATSPVPALASLPEAVRRQLPPLALGGGVYAEQPSQRLVLVNGQVTHEGDDLGRGLRVVQIRPRSVVFSFGEQLFELAL